jgi:hypothetical protein
MTLKKRQGISSLSKRGASEVPYYDRSVIFTVQGTILCQDAIL